MKRFLTLFLFFGFVGINLIGAQDLIVTKFEELDVRILEVNENETIYILKGKTAISTMPNSAIESFKWVSEAESSSKSFEVSSMEYTLMEDLQEELFLAKKRAKRNLGLAGLTSLSGSVIWLYSGPEGFHPGSILLGLGIVYLLDSVNARVSRDEIEKDIKAISVEQFSYHTQQQLLRKAQQLNYLSLSDSGLGLQLNF